MGLKITGSKPARAPRRPTEKTAPARSAIARHGDRQAALAELPDGAVEVLTFLRLVALVFERRRHLLYVVERRRTLEAQLADPALADHPKRAAAERRLAERHDAERLATIALAEDQVRLASLWDALTPADKNRYGLTTLIGEPDPGYQIDLVLWADDRGLSRLVPFPDNWVPAHDIAHRALDPERHGVREYTRDEIFYSDVAGF